MNSEEVLARYAPVRTALLSALAISLVLGFYILVFSAGPTPMEYLVRRPIWAPFLLLCLAATIPFLWWTLLVLRQLMVRDRLAVWVSDGHLKFLSGPLYSISLGSIDSVRVDRRDLGFMKIESVAIETREGVVKIPTAALKERPSEIRDSILRLSGA